MITSVVKITDGKYMINDSIVVHDITYDEKNIKFKIEYDEKQIPKEVAQQLGDEFIMKAVQEAKKQNAY